MFEAKGKWVADLGNGRYKNPILFSDYSDPDVIRVTEGAYQGFYMVASSFTYFPGMPVLYSDDLVNWRIISYAVSSLPFERYNLPQHGCGVWAPAIRYYDGKFWVYFSTPDEGIFMANTENPFNGWNDVVCVREAKGWIDPCPFWDDDGQAYLVRGVAKSRCGLKSMLFMHKMTADGTKLLDDGVRVFDGRINHPTVEGPKMYKRDGYYYILAPAGGVRTGWQMAARSKNIYGPYEHKILMHQGDTVVNGPHQGGLVDLDNGESWFIHFQDLDTYGRVVHLQPARWVNGWPEIGVDTNNDGVGEPVLEYSKPVTGETQIVMPLENDRFTGESLGLQWQWQAHPKKEFYSLTGRSLRLFAIPLAHKGGTLADAPNMLCQLVHSPNIEVTVKLSTKLNQGDCCGLVITGGNYYGLKLESDGTNEYLKVVKYEYDSDETGNATEDVLANMKVAEDVSTLKLKICMQYPGNITFFYSYDEDNFASLGSACSYRVSRKSWVGARVGIYCVNALGEKSDGYADFKSFKVE
jgi:beta-xylosidase